MILKGRKVIWVIMSLLMFVVFTGGLYYMNSANSFVTLAEFIEQEDIEDLSLTIYFFAPTSPTRFPVSVSDLTESFHEYKIIIRGSRQEDIIFDILRNLADTELVLVEGEVRTCARIHYVFETGDGQNIFEVTLWGLEDAGRTNHIIVNGVAVEENIIFYEAIKQFLPANAVDVLNRRINPRATS